MTDFANFFTQNMDRTDPNKKNSMYAQALDQLGPLGGIAGSTLGGQIMGGGGNPLDMISNLGQSTIVGQLLPKSMGGKSGDMGGSLAGMMGGGLLGKFM